MPQNTEDGNILFTFTCAEVKAHLEKRAEHHAKRNAELIAEAKELDAKAQAMLDGVDTVSDRMLTKGSSAYSNDANSRDMKLNSARTHAKHSAKFFYLANHFPSTTENVRLGMYELNRLEFIFE